MKKLNYLMLPALCCATLWSAEWPTDGGGPRRIGWQKDEKILTKENVKDLQILWKLKFDNKPQRDALAVSAADCRKHQHQRRP